MDTVAMQYVFMLAILYFCMRCIQLGKTRNLTVRLEEEALREVEKIADRERSDKSTIARKAIALGLMEMRKEYAVNMYRKGKCSLWKAAEIAGIPLREMMDLAKREKLTLHITPEDVDEAWREAFER